MVPVALAELDQAIIDVLAHMQKAKIILQTATENIPKLEEKIEETQEMLAAIQEDLDTIKAKPVVNLMTYEKLLSRKYTIEDLISDYKIEKAKSIGVVKVEEARLAELQAILTDLEKSRSEWNQVVDFPTNDE